MVYNEIQPLKKTWAFPLVLLLQLGIGILAVSEGFSADQPVQAWISFGLVLLLSGGLLLLFLHMRLEIRMDPSGLQFRSPPFVKSWRKYRWEEITDMQLLSTGPFNWVGGTGLRLGGSLGIRRGWNGEWRYLFSSGNAVRVFLKDRSFVLSTRRTKEFMAAWEAWNVGN